MIETNRRALGAPIRFCGGIIGEFFRFATNPFNAKHSIQPVAWSHNPQFFDDFGEKWIPFAKNGHQNLPFPKAFLTFTYHQLLLKNNMKKIGFLLACLGLFAGASLYGQSSNPRSLENRAVAAAHDCTAPHTGPFTRVWSELVGQGHCTNGGTVNTYAVMVGYTAPASQYPYVLLPGPIVVGYVTFDCDNEISSVTCQ